MLPSTPFRMILLRTSMTTKNWKGDRGSPCLRPLEAWIDLLEVPLIRIEYFTFLTLPTSRSRSTSSTYTQNPSKSTPYPKFSINMIISLFGVKLKHNTLLPQLIDGFIGYKSVNQDLPPSKKNSLRLRYGGGTTLLTD